MERDIASQIVINGPPWEKMASSPWNWNCTERIVPELIPLLCKMELDGLDIPLGKECELYLSLKSPNEVLPPLD